MSKFYPTKTVTLEHNGDVLERVIKADLDRVYVGDKSGEIAVYYETKQSVGHRILFKPGKADEVVRKARMYA